MTKETVTITQTIAFGPAMSALNAQRRAFVMALNNAGGKNATEAARAAGYKDTQYLHTNAQHVLHDPTVQAAIVEDARARLAGDVTLGLNQLDEIAKTPGPSQLAAVKMKLHHAGLVETVKVQHEHTHTLTLKDKVAEAMRLCKITGDDPATMLNGIIDVTPNVISDISAEEPEEW